MDVATTLELQPLSAAGAAESRRSGRRRSPSAFAGHFVLAAPAKPGVYRVTISSGGWVDVLDGGAYLHPKAFSGAKGCEGARKSVKFDLPSRPLALQFSGVPSESDLGHRLARRPIAGRHGLGWYSAANRPAAAPCSTANCCALATSADDPIHAAT